MGNDYSIPILNRSMMIIDYLSNNPEGISFSELQSILSIPKTTMFKILYTLEKGNWIEKRNDRYTLGYKMIHYGMITLSRRNLRKVAIPFLARLAEETNETSHLTVLSGKESMIIEVCESNKHIKMSSNIGSLIPLHCSSHGKVFLAFAVKEPIHIFLEDVDLKRHTDYTITDINKLAEEISLVQNQGYAVDNREFLDNVRCLAAPVRGKDGEVIGAVGITATTITFSEDRILKIADKVLSSAALLSNEMGNGQQKNY